MIHLQKARAHRNIHLSRYSSRNETHDKVGLGISVPMTAILEPSTAHSRLNIGQHVKMKQSKTSFEEAKHIGDAKPRKTIFGEECADIPLRKHSI